MEITPWFVICAIQFAVPFVLMFKYIFQKKWEVASFCFAITCFTYIALSYNLYYSHMAYLRDNMIVP